jgi:hypothetical protein
MLNIIQYQVPSIEIATNAGTSLAKTLRSCAALVLAGACVATLLAGCAGVAQISEPPNDQAEQPTTRAAEDTPLVPPGYRLEQYTLCYEEVGPFPERTRRPSAPIKISMFVPLENCLKFGSDGSLTVGPEKCPRPVPDRGSCKKK